MKFWEAMKIVSEGGRVRRPCWASWYKWVGIVGKRVEVRVGGIDFDVYEPTNDDMMSDDWEEVKDNN